MRIGAAGGLQHVVIVPYENVSSLLDGAKEDCELLKNSFDKLQSIVSEQKVQLNTAENTIKLLKTSCIERAEQLEKVSPILTKLQELADKAGKAWGYVQPIVGHPAFLAVTGLSTLYCGYKTIQTLTKAVPPEGANRNNPSPGKWLAGTLLSASLCALSIYGRTV